MRIEVPLRESKRSYPRMTERLIVRVIPRSLLVEQKFMFCWYKVMKVYLLFHQQQYKCPLACDHAARFVDLAYGKYTQDILIDIFADL